MPDETSAWVDVAAPSEITSEHPVVVQAGRQRVVVVRDEEGQLRAVDDRCPHEGYPLSQGQIRGCTLTCAWHNFKFDLRDGRCLKGDEAVAIYPLRVRAGRVEIDPRRPPDADAIPQSMARLREATLERKLGQMARELARLLALGVPATRLAVEAARIDTAHAEYGCTHALPVSADLLPMLPRFEGPAAALPLMQAFDLASEGSVRRPPRAEIDAVDPGDDLAAAGRRLRALVEQEQAEEAEALLRGTLAAGHGREVLEPWLFGPCCDHMLSFGHPLIYQIKVFDLLEATDWAHAPTLLGGHLLGIVSATREDTLPRWQRFAARLAAVEDALPRWRSAVAPRGDAASLPARARQGWWQAWVEGDRDASFDAVVGALDGGHAPSAVADVIGAAAAARMLRWDADLDGDPTLQEGWLDVTHALTYADAVGHTVVRYRDPSGLRPLFYAARFVNNARSLDSTPAPALPSPSTRPATLEAIDAAVVGRDPEAAVALGARYLADHGPDDALRTWCEDLALRDLYTRPIFVAHVIKVARVAFDLAHRLRGTSWSALPVLALLRLSASRLQERSVRQLVHEAQRLVVDGKVPRTRT